MKVKELMTKNPIWANVDTNIEEVAKLMRDNQCTCIPIFANGENGKPIGIITDRDITVRIVSEDKKPSEVTAGDVMTDKVVVVYLDTDIEVCYRILKDNNIHHLPVLDDEGVLQGIIKESDLHRRKIAFETAKLLRIRRTFVNNHKRRDGVNILL